MTEWQTMATAPKDGTDILICMPGGMSDHFYPVRWTEDDDVEEPCWQCRWQLDMILTEESIKECYLAPMWKPLDSPPSSLCSGQGIVNKTSSLAR